MRRLCGAALLLALSTALPADAAGLPWITANGPAVALPSMGGQLAFTGNAGDRVSLLTQPAAAGGQCVTVALLEPDGATALYSHQQCGAADFSGALVLPATGNYTIAIGGASATTVNLFSVPPDASGALVPGGSAAATIIAPGQNATFAWTGMAGDQASLLVETDMVELAGAPQQQCFAVTVAAPDSSPLAGSSQCGTADFAIPLSLSLSGNYTVHLAPSAPAVGTVQLTLFPVLADEAGPLTPGATRFTADIAAAGKPALFSFNGLAGNRVSLLTETDEALQPECLVVTITAPDGQTQLYQHSQCGSPDFSAALTLPSNGIYAISVAPTGSATGTATLTLYSVPPDASGSVTLGGVGAPLATAIPGQAMQVRFAGTATQTAAIAVAADTALSSQCYTISLFGPNGSALYSDQGCDTAYKGTQQRLPATGIYTIAVSSTGTATGGATIGVGAQ